MTSVAVRSNQPIVTTPEPGPSREERLLATREVAALATQQARALIEPLLARSGTSFEQVLSETYLAVQKNPELTECTPATLLSAVARAVSWGLRLGEEVHLVPFNVKVKDKGGERWEKQAQAIRDYKGDIAMCLWSGAARSIDAHCVYAAELEANPPRFELTQGDRPSVMHKPILMPAMRGKLAGAYAIARISQTDIRVVFMSAAEIDEIRMKHSKQWKEKWVDGRKVPIALDEIPWYARKSCVHQVTKMLPKTKRLEQVLAAFEEERTEMLEPEIDPLPAERQLNPSGEVRPASSTTASGPADVAAAADPAPAQSSIDEDDGVMTLEKAVMLKLPGGKKAFDGQGGTPLGELEPRRLAEIRKYFERRIADAEEAGGRGATMFVEVRDACNLIMESRTPTKIDTKIAPGKVEDAYDKKELERPAPTLEGVRAQILALSKDPKLDDLERDLIKSRLAKADAVEGALLILQDLETTLSLPF